MIFINIYLKMFVKMNDNHCGNSNCIFIPHIFRAADLGLDDEVTMTVESAIKCSNGDSSTMQQQQEHFALLNKEVSRCNNFHSKTKREKLKDSATGNLEN